MSTLVKFPTLSCGGRMAPLCKGGCHDRGRDWGIVAVRRKAFKRAAFITIPPSFCCAKIHLPLHKGSFIFSTTRRDRLEERTYFFHHQQNFVFPRPTRIVPSDEGTGERQRNCGKDTCFANQSHSTFSLPFGITHTVPLFFTHSPISKEDTPCWTIVCCVPRRWCARAAG